MNKKRGSQDLNKRIILFYNFFILDNYDFADERALLPHKKQKKQKHDGCYSILKTVHLNALQLC